MKQAELSSQGLCTNGSEDLEMDYMQVPDAWFGVYEFVVIVMMRCWGINWDLWLMRIDLHAWGGGLESLRRLACWDGFVGWGLGREVMRQL
jgi:hypothetical protein